MQTILEYIKKTKQSDYGRKIDTSDIVNKSDMLHWIENNTEYLKKDYLSTLHKGFKDYYMVMGQPTYTVYCMNKMPSVVNIYKIVSGWYPSAREYSIMLYNGIDEYCIELAYDKNGKIKSYAQLDKYGDIYSDNIVKNTDDIIRLTTEYLERE